MVANPKTFPSGIKALADYVHGKGLKLGLYSSAGYVFLFFVFSRLQDVYNTVDLFRLKKLLTVQKYTKS
jgi:hypothetical protein